jgi:hypothetical protein
MEPTNDDAAIAEFHAAARKRRQRIMAITAIICALVGIGILVVTFTAGDANGEGGRFEGRTLVVGAGFIVAAFVSAGMAFKGE